MNRITKLFGRKDNAEEDQVQVTPAPEQSFQNLSEQEFGLMFTVEDGNSQTFTTLPIMIGRSEQNTLILKDPSVSAKHAYVFYDDRLQKVCIIDLDSTNGLYINDQPTRKNVLQDDARIRLGSVALTFRDTGYIHSGT